MSRCRIATLNLQNFAAPPLAYYEWDAIYSASQWQAKTDWLKRSLTAIKADVVAFQEVFSKAELQQLCLALGFEHFYAPSEPELLDQHVYRKPVVALASRWPLTPLVLPPVEQAWLDAMGVAHFADSREPLLARIEVPQFGSLDVAVVHLKSRRTDAEYQPALGQWLPSLQRGLEACLLALRLQQHYQQHQRPLLLGGDFNDVQSSALLQPLFSTSMQAGLFKLQDAATLAPEGARPPTHYYGAHGQVLDAWLVSAEFDPRFHHSLATVRDYQVVDTHLVRPVFAEHGYSSDHAFVWIELEARR